MPPGKSFCTPSTASTSMNSSGSSAAILTLAGSDMTGGQDDMEKALPCPPGPLTLSVSARRSGE